MNTHARTALSKVPVVGLLCIKILATTLGETGGDAVTMSMDLGYLVGTAIFAVVFLVGGAGPDFGQKVSIPMLYWVNHHRHHDRGNDFGGFCRPLAGHRLRGRFGASVRPADGVPFDLV